MEGSWPKRGPVYAVALFGPILLWITAMTLSSRNTAPFRARCKATLAVFATSLWLTVSAGAYINVLMVEFFRTGKILYGKLRCAHAHSTGFEQAFL